jgi:hypothetical protein
VSFAIGRRSWVRAAVIGLAATHAIAQTATTRDPRLSLDLLPVTARLDLPSSADWMTFGFGSIWIVNYRPSRVSRVDASTNQLKADITIGRSGTIGRRRRGIRRHLGGKQRRERRGSHRSDAIRWGAGSLWVADHAVGQLWRIDHRRIAP